MSNFASLLLVGALAAGILGVASATDVASAGKASLKRGDSARAYVLESRRRARGPVILLPIGPAYVYYDYPYYYSRGFYPTHIGRYVYYSPNLYGRGPYGGAGSLRRLRAHRH
jgi:hypothetical protein